MQIILVALGRNSLVGRLEMRGAGLPFLIRSYITG